MPTAPDLRPTRATRATRAIAALLSVALAAQPLAAQAATTDLTDVPLMVQTGVKPNVLFTLDNSASMDWGSITGSDASAEYTSPYDDALRAGHSTHGKSLDGAKNKRAYYSPSYNLLYYNPALTYLPGVQYSAGADTFTESMGPSRPEAAGVDPYLGAPSAPDLRQACWSTTTPPELPRFDADDFHLNGHCATDTDAVNTTPYARYAFYYVWRGSGTETGNADQDNDGNYDRVEILPETTSYPRAATRTDCGAGPTCSYLQEIQNFANWFTYYRTRILSAKSALGLAFATLDAKSRVGFSAINNQFGFDNTNGAFFVPLADFDSSQKQAWYNQLHAIDPRGGTPLVSALDRAGRYFETGTMPGAHHTSRSTTVPLGCTPNYTILSTDGYWSGHDASVGNRDATVPTLPADVYTDPATGARINDPVAGAPLTVGEPFPAPFYDGNGASNTLADVAMNYWIKDLHSPSAGKVLPNLSDPATWQHMVTYTIGLGASGTLSEPPTGANTWPTPTPGSPTAIDDLWHAALNGHGQYFNSSDPSKLQKALGSILNDIVNRTGSSAGVAVSNPNVQQGDNLAFTSSFNSGAWYGDLKAFPIDVNTGVLAGAPLWSAQERLDAKPFTSRYIGSYDGVQGVAFRPTGLPSRKDRLNSPTSPPGPGDHPAVFDYLRGDRSGEGDGSDPAKPYRARIHVMGDVVDAEPSYVSAPRAAYTDAGYTLYKSGPAASRAKVVYQGANDGMLHAFDATTGEELWAYVPSGLIDTRLSATFNGFSALVGLTQQSLFQHRFYVDGTPTATDMDLSRTFQSLPTFPAPNWRTLLIGGLGKGGRSYYALDVTNPAASSDADVALKVLWEFPNSLTDATVRSSVGYTYGTPLNVKTEAAGWVTLVTSGYNNGGVGADKGKGHLFVLDPANGRLIRDLNTGAGTGDTPSGLARISAFLIQPGVDETADYVYGGDLLGNVWRFDLTGNDVSRWNVKRLATLVDKTGRAQPVTTAPELGVLNGKRMVYVGTGQYLGSSDIPGLPGSNVHASQPQSFYGLMDDLSASPTISPLRAQLVAQTATAAGDNINVTTNPVNLATRRGWVLDFATSPVGERATTSPVLFGGLLAFTTNIPSSDPCTPGGSSNLYFLNYTNGGAIPSLASRYVGNVLASRVQPIGLRGGSAKILVRTSDGVTRVFDVAAPNFTNPARVMWREVVVN